MIYVHFITSGKTTLIMLSRVRLLSEDKTFVLLIGKVDIYIIHISVLEGIWQYFENLKENFFGSKVILGQMKMLDKNISGQKVF